MQLRTSWLTFGFVLLFAWMDWILHRELSFVLMLVGGAVAVALFGNDVLGRTSVGRRIASLGARQGAYAAALLPIAYVTTRGNGTAGLAWIVSPIAMLAAGIGRYGDRADERLKGYYRIRNRVLPKVVRQALVLALPVVVAFLIVHGTLGDLPALWGGKTAAPKSPRGAELRLAVATLASGAIAYLLVREDSDVEAPSF